MIQLTPANPLSPVSDSGFCLPDVSYPGKPVAGRCLYLSIFHLLILAILCFNPWAIRYAAATDLDLEDFIGTAGGQPAGWFDATDYTSFNAQIAYSYINSYAVVTRTALGASGKSGRPDS